MAEPGVNARPARADHAASAIHRRPGPKDEGAEKILSREGRSLMRQAERIVTDLAQGDERVVLRDRVAVWRQLAGDSLADQEPLVHDLAPDRSVIPKVFQTDRQHVEVQLDLGRCDMDLAADIDR